jgi:hypothetical protein
VLGEPQRIRLLLVSAATNTESVYIMAHYAKEDKT